jgi:anti-sigma B factor antagonist
MSDLRAWVGAFFRRLASPRKDLPKSQISGKTVGMTASRAFIDIATRQSGNTTIVDVNGDITLRSTPEVRKVLLDALKNKGTTRAIVNLVKVRYIDSAGVASLVEALRVSRDLNRGFALYGLGRVARQVLELTRLTKVFEIYDDEEQALRGASPSQA